MCSEGKSCAGGGAGRGSQRWAAGGGRRRRGSQRPAAVPKRDRSSSASTHLHEFRKVLLHQEMKLGRVWNFRVPKRRRQHRCDVLRHWGQRHSEARSRGGDGRTQKTLRCRSGCADRAEHPIRMRARQRAAPAGLLLPPARCIAAQHAAAARSPPPWAGERPTECIHPFPGAGSVCTVCHAIGTLHKRMDPVLLVMGWQLLA